MREVFVYPSPPLFAHPENRKYRKNRSKSAHSESTSSTSSSPNSSSWMMRSAAFVFPLAGPTTMPLRLTPPLLLLLQLLLFAFIVTTQIYSLTAQHFRLRSRDTHKKHSHSCSNSTQSHTDTHTKTHSQFCALRIDTQCTMHTISTRCVIGHEHDTHKLKPTSSH